MTLLLIVLLVVLWGVVIVPTLLRHRQSPRSSSDKFREHLAALNARSQVRASTRRRAGTGGRWIMGPPVSHSGRPRRTGASTRPAASAYRGPRNAVDQRRNVFFWLLGGSVASLVLGLMPHLGFLIGIGLVLIVALAGDVVYLVRIKRRQDLQDLFSFAEPQPEEEHWLAAGEM